jgi:hypothetical protein
MPGLQRDIDTADIAPESDDDPSRSEPHHLPFAAADLDQVVDFWRGDHERHNPHPTGNFLHSPDPSKSMSQEKDVYITTSAKFSDNAAPACELDEVGIVGLCNYL